MRSSSFAVSLLSLAGAGFAAPAPKAAAAPELEERQLLSLGLGALTSLLPTATPTATPTNVQDAFSKMSNIHVQAQPTNIVDYSNRLIANGLVSGTVNSLLTYVNGGLTGQASENNKNPNPPTKIFPKKNATDAPYDISENTLRGAIYIPSEFLSEVRNGQKPVILVPGTGDNGYTTFIGNYIPLLRNSTQFSPVWLNIPGFLLNDAQGNAEFVAYAVNYINSVTSKNVSVIGWSQGNIDTQWAFKYWPSTRNVTSDHIAFSPDYDGTVNANFITGTGDLQRPAAPAVLQQQYLADSKFITQLQKNNGDSAYVPTTTVYSGLFDEIVEPQQDPIASAILNDVRKVGVSNNQVQLVCPGQPGGSFYPHEGTLYNPIGFALAVDAMTHDGPGLISRTGTSQCSNFLTPGLDLGDFLITENTVVIAALAIAAYNPKVTQEPAIKSYATY